MTAPKSYYEAVGKRKTAVARARLHSDFSKSIKPHLEVNETPLDRYFPTEEHQHLVRSSIQLAKLKNYNISVKVSGGGLSGQAEAVKLAIARVLLLSDEHLHQGFKSAGFLRRDARVKERRKFGLKKARKAPQWSKR